MELASCHSSDADKLARRFSDIFLTPSTVISLFQHINSLMSYVCPTTSKTSYASHVFCDIKKGSFIRI